MIKDQYEHDRIKTNIMRLNIQNGNNKMEHQGSKNSKVILI